MNKLKIANEAATGITKAGVVDIRCLEPDTSENGAADGTISNHWYVLDIVRGRVSTGRAVSFESAFLEIQDGRHKLQCRVLAGGFHVTIDAAGADRPGNLAVKCLLKVVLVVPWLEVGCVALVLLVVALGMDHRFLEVTRNETFGPRVQERLVDRDVPVKFVIQPEPLQGSENDGFPDLQARSQVLGGRGPVTEPDDLDLVRGVDLCTGQDVEESAGFLWQDDHMAQQSVVGGTVRRNFTIDAIGCPLAIKHSSVRVKSRRAAG